MTWGLLAPRAEAQEILSSDRFLIKILDRTVSFQDISYQTRNLKALKCLHEESLITQYFGDTFLSGLTSFVEKFPATDKAVVAHLHQHEELLKNIRHLFKMLRYSEDQNNKVSKEITSLIRKGTRANNCESEILYKDTLKTNFTKLLELELYLKSRYENQLKSSKGNFSVIKPSMELFIDSLDKQFGHEYYW